MDIKISDDTIKATTECKKNFSCLTGNREDLWDRNKYDAYGL